MYDMQTINHKYFEKHGFNKSNKNQAADYFAELADALGFSLDLLKEGHNHNGKYCFHDEDVDTVFAILDWAKSSEGKRLRCRDYRGAGWEFMERLVQALLKLMRINGATFMAIWEQEYRIAATTDFTIQIEKLKELKPELASDFEDKFFMCDNPIHEKDGFSLADQYTFLNFVLEHLDFDAKDIRGVYWFWKLDNESRSMDSTISMAKQLRRLSHSEFEAYKQHLIERVHLEEAMDSDTSLQTTLDQWYPIQTGERKLKDNRDRKPLVRKAIDRIDQLASEYLKTTSPMVCDNGEDISFAEAMFEGEEHLLLACDHYSEWKQFRREHPIDAENRIKLCESMFEDRFGFSL